MVKRYYKNSVFIATLICIILFYSKIIELQDRNKFHSLINTNEINFLYGQLNSSPVKCSNQKYYSSNLNVYECQSINNFKSTAKGNINIYIPVEIVEAFYPGKLYSKSIVNNKDGYLWETGGIYKINGYYKNNSFYVEECIYSEFPNTIFGKIDKFRALCRLQFKRLMFSWGEAGGLLLALLCGAKEYTSITVSEAFKNSGLSHILALSGMHLSMFSGIAIFFGNKIGRKKLTFIIRIIALILFVWFAGLSPSLLRAFLCNILLIISALANVKKPDMIIILCFSFLMQTIMTPSDIYNAGFILSYGALAGILLTNNYFQKIYFRFLPKSIGASVASSTGAQIFTAPISLKIFGSFAPIGIIATCIVSPFVTIFIYSGLLLILLTLLFPCISAASGFFINLQYTIIKFFVSIFSKAFIWRIN